MEQVYTLGQLFTHGTWKAKRGHEREFAAAWEDLAEWTRAHGYSGRGTLLQDIEDRTLFVSFGPWASVEEIGRWRGDPGFQERISQMQEFLESSETQVMELVAGG